MTAKIQSILAELKVRLLDLYGNRLDRLVLYGSQARGDAQPDSDIDVLVVLKGNVNPWQEILHSEIVSSDISLRHDVVISKVFVSSEEFYRGDEPLLTEVRREGIAF